MNGPQPTLQAMLYENRERLPMFVIYDRPTDFPEDFVARLHWSLPAHQPTAFVVRAKNVEDLRDLMEGLGLVKLMRREGDPAQVMEVWL